MKRAALGIVVVVLAVAVGWLAVQRIRAAPDQNVLYGNVEIRQVDLAFNSEGTVTLLRKHEGDEVKAGEDVAELDPATYRSGVALAQARRDAAQAQLDKALNGTRKEELDQVRAAVAAAQANLANAQVSYARQQGLVASHASPQQELDDARRALDASRAQLDQSQAALAEAVAGPRVEDIAAARAQLAQAEASLDLARTELARTVLSAPSDGTIMTRVIEPGTVVLPGAAVYSMAIGGEVWVRGFVPEPLLARVVPGSEVLVYTDGRPDKPYHGRIGYVSPSAEFTPKTVETPELRTQLVYRIRVRLTDADDGIRQGQPVTIRLPGR